MLHDADDSFDDVVNIGEVAFALAVVEYLDGLAGFELVGEAEVGHVGAAGGAIDGKEAQACAGDVVEFAVGVGHELVALFGGGVQRYGVIDFVVGGVRDFFVAAIDAGRACIDEVFEFAFACACAASFQNIVKADEVALDVGVRVGDGIADAGLCGEVHDDGEVVLLE